MKRPQFKTAEELSRYLDLNRTITQLDLQDHAWLTSLPSNMSTTIEVLGLLRCTGFTEILFSLPALRVLTTSGCENAILLQDPLPDTLQHLLARDCARLKKAPSILSTQMRTLDYTRCVSLKGEIILPPFIEHFSIDGCGAMSAFPVLPESTEYANGSNCPWIIAFPNLLTAPNLKFILLRNSRIVKGPDLWPATLRVIDMAGSTELVDLSAPWPDTIEYAFLTGCPNLRNLPEERPAALKKMVLIGNNDVRIPDRWYKNPLGNVVLPNGSVL